MRWSMIILLLTSVVLSCVARPEDKYTTKYDNIDVDDILQSDRLLKNYMNCVLDKGKCTPAGQELKQNLPDGLENNCSKCSPKQREVGEKIVKFLYNERPEYFSQLEAKYDPTGTYRKRYQADLDKLKN